MKTTIFGWIYNNHKSYSESKNFITSVCLARHTYGFTTSYSGSITGLSCYSFTSSNYRRYKSWNKSKNGEW